MNSKQQQQRQTAGDYKEFRLLAAGPTMKHHIMKINHEQFAWSQLQRPVRLARHDPVKEKQIQEALAAAATSSNEPTEPKPDRPVADRTQIAPFGTQRHKAPAERQQNAGYLARKKKNKTKSYSYARDELKAPLVKDADKNPWILSDFEQTHSYTGTLQGSQDSTFCLFVCSDDGFKVIPVSKWYKFQKNIKHRVLTTEEAEAKMKDFAMQKPSDRWMMHQKEESVKEENAGGSKDATKDTKEPKEWKLKLLQGHEETKEKKPSRGRKPKREHVEELDFEEDFADDEEVDFGIEDKEEAKEASKRLYGEAANKSFFGSEDWDDFEEIDGSKGPTSTMEKALAKALRRFEKNEAYEDDDDENPYISDLEEDEKTEDILVKKEPSESLKLDDFVTSRPSARPLSPSPGVGDASMALKRLKSLTGRAVAPEIKKDRSDSPGSDGEEAASVASSGSGDVNEKKRKRTDETSLPLPPTASEVLARELGKSKKGDKGKRSNSPSTKPGSPEYSRSNSPSPGSGLQSPSTPGDLLKDEEVIKLLKSRAQPFTVKEIIAHFKAKLVQNPKNKDVIRGIMKRVLEHDKATGHVSLKKEFI